MTGQAYPHCLPRGAQPPATDIDAAPGAPTFDAVAGDGTNCRFTLSMKTIIIGRDIGGLNCTVSIPGSFYDAVCLNIGQNDYTVTLANTDSALSLTIGALDDLAQALDLRDDLARQLRLPAQTGRGMWTNALFQ